ncbi:flagellar motor switch phosphatase FliY [Lachnospira eligens]|uniref:Flagellar motor switch protein FliN/FliY n=1 Tax=Lachnospira eligens (strain ATCC 27750 / DSM 3376 / VPI C15-48 / C15-B4) TaxID=515620 RepID=C4Z5H2_LACE2|nr:flagellar motor switch phosphatase FliY [Lachnospira eligens]ACR71831.1 flagellar motor switch protein FliN/FliY [[Eubacterium] eligens ATCC 27750]UEA97209.1 flagellar motor switch phosphatase FliY [Lachnospira eligens]
MDGMLSQDEINALLSGMGSGGDDAESTGTATVTDTPDNNSAEDSFTLTESEKDAVGEISNISMGTAATTLSSLLSQKVNITTPKVEVATWDDLSREYDRPCVMMQISYKEGLAGNNVLILKENDVKIITDLMMGGTGTANPDEPLSELHLSAIGEAMNQMMGSAATSMSSMFNRKIDISPPVANLVETYNELDEGMPAFLNKPFVKVAFKMQIGDLIDSEIMQLYPKEFAQELLNMFTPSSDDSSNSQPQPEPQPASQAPVQQPAPQAQPVQQPAPQAQSVQQPDMNMQQAGMMGQAVPQQGMAMQQGMPMQGMPYGYGMPMQGMMGQPMPMQGYAQPQDVNVAPAAFQPFATDVNPISQKENIELIKDVPLEVTVELGRTTKSIKDILEFAPGTIVELNKIAGESVDVLVNGKYVAKGEVVVIEESFGVRITEIIK